MKRNAIVGLAVLGAAVIAVAQTGPDLLKNYVAALNKAEGLSVTYTLTPVGKSPEKYDLKLTKPNQARIETPSKLIVADGTTITTYLKQDKAYFKKAQAEGAVQTILANEGLNIWAPFYDSKVFNKVAAARSEADATLKGVSYKVVKVSFDSQGNDQATLYLDKSDKIVRKAQYVSTTTSGVATSILNVEAIALTKPAGNDLYAFKAPDGSKEVKEEDLMGGKWLTNWEDAVKLSKATGKVMMVDFYTDWCHWCKELDAKVFSTKEFKEAAKNLILVKINAEVRTDVAGKYNVSSYPCIIFINKDQQEVHRISGYMETPAFVAQMKKVTG